MPCSRTFLLLVAMWGRRVAAAGYITNMKDVLVFYSLGLVFVYLGF